MTRRTLLTAVLAVPTAALPLLLSAGPVAATHLTPGPAAPPALPRRPAACGAAPAWVDDSPDQVAAPAPGVVVRTWQGRGSQGIPMRVVAAEADAVRVSLTVALPARFGQVLPTTELTRRAGALAGVNGDYFDPGPAGAVPRGVEVARGDVRYAPAGGTRGVGVGADGLLRAGRLQVVGSVGAGTTELPVTSVNAAKPAARGVAVRTAFGSAQPRPAAWYALVRHGLLVSSSARDPGPPRGDDVLLTAPSADRAALAAIGVGATVAVQYAVQAPDGAVLTDALGSSDPILAAGAIVSPCTGSYGTGWRPRTVVAWDNRTARLWLITVNATVTGEDGVGVRGLTYGECADLARRWGASDAVLLDGGHSTTFSDGSGRRVDAPVGAMRPVADAAVLAPT